MPALGPSAQALYADVPHGLMPPGFVAIDLAKALALPLYDPDSKNATVNEGSHPRLSNGIIGNDAANPEVVVAANGGSDLVYLPKGNKELAGGVVAALLAQDYSAGCSSTMSWECFPARCRSVRSTLRARR